MPVYGHQKFYWYKEPIAELDQVPLQNTWYEALPETKNIRLISIATRRLDDDANAKITGVRVTVDGTNYDESILCADNTWVYWYLDPVTDGMLGSTSVFNASRYCDLRGRSVKVQCRLESAPGANAELYARIQYATWRPT